MPPIQPSGHLFQHASVDRFGGGTQDVQPALTDLQGFIPSTELLQGAKAIGILHNGSVYRLQATKLGKLILTK